MATTSQPTKPEPPARVTREPAAFAAQLPARGALVGLDASPRRIGVAATDPDRRLVSALLTFERRGGDADLRQIRRIVEERRAAGLVVGFPISMDGREGPAAQAALQLAEALSVALSLPVLLQDERLTSFAVAEAVREGRIRLSKRGPRHLDHYAAAVILEDALRAMQQGRNQTPR